MSLCIPWLILAALASATGWPIVRRLAPQFTLPARIGWSWIVGQALLSLGGVIALVSGFGAAWALPILTLPLFFSTPISMAKEDRRPGAREKDPLLRGLALAFALLALIVAWRSPGLGWDGLAIWGLKARTIAEIDGPLRASTLNEPISISMHPEYPLHVPILGAVLGDFHEGIGGEGWDDRTLPVLAALDLLAILLLLVAAFEGAPRRRPLWRPCLFVGALLTPIVWRELPEGKADLTLALCLLAATLGILEWWRSEGESPGGLDKNGPLWLAALAGGLGAWTKQEGLVWLFLVACLTFFFTSIYAPKKRRPFLGPTALALSIAAPWHIFRLQIGLTTESFVLSFDQIGRLPQIAETFLLELANLSHWGLLWLVVWPAFLLLDLRALIGRSRPGSPKAGEPSSKGSRIADRFLLSLLGAGLATLVVIFLATPHDLEWHLSTALDRLLLQWWPIAILVIEAGGRALERRFQGPN